jgi:parvulin-like peptidyl-prolyl isomerase
VKRLLALLLAGCLVASACGAVQTGADAAVVNGQPITRSALDGELGDIAANKAFVTALEQLQGGPGPVQATVKGTYTQSFVAFALTRRIEYLLIHEDLVGRNALPDASAVAAARAETEQDYNVTLPGASTATPLLGAFPAGYQTTLVERRADLDALTKTLVKTNVTDQQVRQYYDTHPGDFLTEICVRHILVTDQATAQKVKARLDAGADFATLAKADSTDTGSAAKGGALTGSAPDGCLNSTDVSQLISEFATAMLALPVDQVSQPVQSQYGYHLIEVTSRRVEPYDAQSQQGARRALEQPSQQEVSTLFNGLVQRANVRVDAAFGHFEKNGGNGPAVVPPASPQLPTSVGAPGAPTTTAPGG